MTSTQEQIGALNAQVEGLINATNKNADLLREHMLREEAMTRELLGRLAALDKKLGAWQGMAAGAGLIVSAGWAVVLAAITWIRH